MTAARPHPLAAQLRTELWAMEPHALAALLAEVEALPSEVDIKAAGFAPPGADEGPGYEARDGVAHIAIAGPIMRSVPWIAKLLGLRATSVADTHRALAQAVASQDVRAIQLDVDSPGGVVSGIHELGEAIAAAGATKPTAARIEGAGHSAAYWLAARAKRITAAPSSTVGSIGVLATLSDSSASAAQAGVKVHVVASAPLKGMDVPGAPVSPEQVTELQRLVDGMAAMFVDAVAAGRGMSTDEAKKLATGQVWLAADAQKLGLIDEVTSAAPPIADSSAATSATASTAPTSAQEKETMADPTAPAATQAGADEVKQLREQVAKLEADKAKAEAAAAAQATALAEAKAAQKATLLASYADHVSPAMKASVEAFAGKADIAELETFLKGLPVATRPGAVGGTPEERAAGAAELSADDKAAADLFGISHDVMARFSGATYVEPAANGQKARIHYADRVEEVN